IRALHDAEPGEVQVVDGGGGTRALAGELFATEADRRKLAGIVIDGACRDILTLATLQIPLYARWACPAPGTAERLGTTQQAVVCGGVNVQPGDVVIGDRDGIVVVSEGELLALLPQAEEVQRTEARFLERLMHGEGLLGMLKFTEHCEALKQGRPRRLRIQPQRESRRTLPDSEGSPLRGRFPRVWCCWSPAGSDDPPTSWSLKLPR